MSKIIQKSIYGSVAILKAYCKKCEQTSFVVDGRYTCCGELLVKIPEKERIKREVEGEIRRSNISLKVKQEILEEQENKCIYCENILNELWWNKKKSKYIKLRIHYDHFVSWNYSRDNHKYNIFASCHICNSIKSDKYFADLISAREFINEERKKKGY